MQITFFQFKWNGHLHITFKQGNVHLDRTSFKESSILRTGRVDLEFLIDELRVLIIEYFEDKQMEDGWSANDKMAAIGFKKYLRKFESIFLFKLFSSVIASSYILYHVLQTKPLDVISCATKINEFHEYLRHERDTEFELLWK